jgi:hypothetical protein
VRKGRVIAALLAVIALAYVTAQWRGRAAWAPVNAPAEPGLVAP